MDRKKVSLIGLECQDRLVENFLVVANEQWQHVKLGYGRSQSWHSCSATVWRGAVRGAVSGAVRGPG